MIEQLVDKNCTTGDYHDIYPISVLPAIKDDITGKTLDIITNEIGHIQLQFISNKKDTRNQIHPHYRKKGLFITYPYKGQIITEEYRGESFKDSDWGNNKNWVQNLTSDVINKSLLDGDGKLKIDIITETELFNILT